MGGGPLPQPVARQRRPNALGDVKPVLVACGVLREARIAEAVGGVVAVAGGGRADLLEARLKMFAVRGARGVASFGLCGALMDGLAVGDFVIADGVGSFAADARWTTLSRARGRGKCAAQRSEGEGGGLSPRHREALLPLPGASHLSLSRVSGRGLLDGRVHADGHLATTPAAKRALHAATGAAAIDMESHIAARVAARHDLPLLIARVVSDRADQSLPPAFAQAMRPDGGTDVAAMLASIARNPAQLSRVIAAAADTVRALASLRRLSRLLGPGLGFPDFA